MITDNFKFDTLMPKEYARMMIMIFRKINGIIKKEKQAEWLNTPNDALDSITPLEIMLKKPTKLNEVFLILCRIEWGISV